MREFDEVLRGSFDAHTGEIDRAGGPGLGLATRTVRDVRRKRAWRAGATGGVAAAAVVGVVATALAVTGGDAGPVAQSLVTSDPYSLGSCTSYIPANGALLPEGKYEGRAYVDPAAGFVVAVMPDGTVTRVQPGPDGDYSFDFGNGSRSLMLPTEYPIVLDFFSDGSAGGGRWVDADPVGWEWTLEPIEGAPAGVNSKSLASVLPITLGFAGDGYEPSAIPDGAMAEVVAIYADGHEVTHALVAGGPGPTGDQIDHAGLEAVALRVTLADGRVWEIRADYTPENVPDLPCQPTPPSRTQPTYPSTATEAPATENLPSETPATEASATAATGESALPGLNDSPVLGAALSGPEATVFTCGAPLPSQLEGTAGVRARSATGNVSIGQSDLFRLGDDGLVVEGQMPIWRVSMDSDLTQPLFPGWFAHAGGEADGSIRGNVGLVEIVAVKDGVIAAAAAQPVMDSAAGGPGNAASVPLGFNSSTSTSGFLNAYNGVHGLLVPCDDTAGDLSGTQLAVIYGFGPDVDHITYGWTAVAD